MTPKGGYERDYVSAMVDFWEWVPGGERIGADLELTGGQQDNQQAQNPNNLINPPCGVNPITSQYGFTNEPRGQAGHLRPGEGGRGNFGANRSSGNPHAGLDISASNGSLIYASQEGRITVATSGGDYGNWIEIDHGRGVKTRYAHNSENYVAAGDYVLKGEIIGAVGVTGNARNLPVTETHVHFEVRFNGVAGDPATYLNLPCNWSLTSKIPTNWRIMLLR